MTDRPRLSIGLPVYNGEEYLAESFDALLGQTYEDFELVVSDNASTDGTEDICRKYAAQDSRIRYLRLPRNIGATPNHNHVFAESRGELFKWASHDDLYGRDLLTRCIEALDERPDVILAHTDQAVIDGDGQVTVPYDYTLATDSPHAPDRFRSLLFEPGGDDFYGVIRADVLRRVKPMDSYHHADRTFVAEITLHGRFHQVPELLYFRRDHPTRAERANPSKRARCVNLDPRRAGLLHPTPRLLAEYVWGFASSIRRAPLSPADRRACYRHLASWMTSRVRPGAGERVEDRAPVDPAQLTVSVDALVAGREEARMTSAPERPVRVGVFGLLGSGNLGNDGSLEAVLGYLRADHPDAVVDALCGGPEAVTARFGIPATRMHWNRAEYRTASRLGSIASKGLGKFVDIFRTAAWVRKHDVVIVPGMGVLEATLPLRPWGFPYSLFLLCASGRLMRTRIALVSVGAAEIRNRPTRALVRWSGRLAAYRSYRDAQSRDAMRAMGVDTARDEVYPDLAFSLPAPPASTPSDVPGTVCVGVMDFHGGNDDRARADEIYRRYLDGTIRFVRTLVEEGRPVRLLTGDRCDATVVAAILDAVGSPLVTAAEPTSLDDLMNEMVAADTVVAVRYHNLICALKTGTPVLALSYAAKSDALMDRMGLGAYCHPAREVDADRLLEQFRALEKRSAELRGTLAERNLAAARQLRDQFDSLTAAVFPATDHTHAHARQESP